MNTRNTPLLVDMHMSSLITQVSLPALDQTQSYQLIPVHVSLAKPGLPFIARSEFVSRLFH